MHLESKPCYQDRDRYQTRKVDHLLEFKKQFLRREHSDAQLHSLLSGPPNPKTTIPPIVAAPSHELAFWKTNNLVSHSAINSATPFYAAESGFAPDASGPAASGASGASDTPFIRPLDETFTFIKRLDSGPAASGASGPAASGASGPAASGASDTPSPFIKPLDETFIRRLPFKLDNADASRTDQLLTQTLQPGVYQKSHVGEPIQSNIGISHTEPFAPTGIDVQGHPEQIKFTQYGIEAGPAATPGYSASPGEGGLSRSDVYDPRFSGYGTSYRGYVDNMGRPQFFYDDIDAVTMPAIVRSNVDVFPWASSDANRQQANDTFTEATIRFRTEMQESLMRKRNAELWQRRQYPISTMQRL